MRARPHRRTRTTSASDPRVCDKVGKQLPPLGDLLEASGVLLETFSQPTQVRAAVGKPGRERPKLRCRLVEGSWRPVASIAAPNRSTAPESGAATQRLVRGLARRPERGSE